MKMKNNKLSLLSKVIPILTLFLIWGAISLIDSKLILALILTVTLSAYYYVIFKIRWLLLFKE